MTSGQEWDESDTQKMTISNKLSAHYQRRRCAVDRWSLATPPGAQYDGNEYEALPFHAAWKIDLSTNEVSIFGMAN